MNPLKTLHDQPETEFQTYGETEIVQTFGQPQAEYAAIRRGCGIMDCAQRTAIEVTGEERLPFLNNLLTNQTWDKGKNAPLPAGQGVYSFLLNPKGRIISDMDVLEAGGRTLLVMDERMVKDVLATLDRHLFREKVKLASLAGQIAVISLHGPEASTVLSRTLAQDVALPESSTGNLPVCELPHGQDARATVYRDDITGVPGLHIIVPVSTAPALWQALTAQGQDAPLGKRTIRPIGWAAFNAARVEAGRPIFGIDFDQTVMPAETGLLTRAISFTKGCYVGQEIVARMNSRGQLARKLVPIRMSGEELPVAGTAIEDKEGHQVGAVTSSTVSPKLSGTAICLGLLQKGFFDPGCQVLIPAEGALREGQIVEKFV